MTVYVDHLPDLVRVAVQVVERGWPVLAIRPGTKQPVHGGSALPNHREHWLRTPEQVVAAWENTADALTGRLGCQFALITGVPNEAGESAALIDADVDGDWTRLDDVLVQAGPAGVAWAGSTLLVQQSSDREHLVGVVTGRCPPTQLLAPGIEWRGDGGYVMLPGALHLSGRRYRVTRPSEPLPVPAGLLALASPSAPAEPARAEPVEVTEPGGTAFERVLDALGSRVAQHRADGSVQAHCPGPSHRRGDRDPSLSIRDAGDLVLLHCFAGCTAGQVAAALGLTEADLFDDSGTAPIELVIEVEAEALEVAENLPGGLVDFSYLRGRHDVPPRPRPSILLRSDGLGLFYPGLVNNVYGPQEVGKSWIDLDYMGRETGERLALLGVPVDVLADRDRLRVYAPMDLAGLMVAVEEVVRWGSELNVLDAVSGLLPMIGAKTNDADEFSVAWRTFVVPLASVRNGRTAITIDHTAKDAAITSGPSGTAAKGRPTRGAQVGVLQGAERLIPGRGGSLHVWVFKDTYGALRSSALRIEAAEHYGMPAAGTFLVTYNGPTEESFGSLSWSFEAPKPAKKRVVVPSPDGGTVEVEIAENLDAEAEQVAETCRARPSIERIEVVEVHGPEAWERALELELVRECQCGSGCEVCPADRDMRGRWRSWHCFAKE